MISKRTLDTKPAPSANPSASKAFHGQPAARMRAADYVFETLSRAILSGELAPGSVLATQRELAKQFAVSPLVIRQATHRLEDLGLVRVRQGSTTIVLDPDDASDVRLMQVQLELAQPSDKFALAARETQALFTISMLALAARRITDAQLDELDALVEQRSDTPTPEEALVFQMKYWGMLARATHNPVLEHQVRWWWRVMADMSRKSGTRPAVTPNPPAPVAIYRGLNRALRRRRGAAEFWLSVLEPLFAWTESQPGHAYQLARRPASAKQVRAQR